MQVQKKRDTGGEEPQNAGSVVVKKKATDSSEISDELEALAKEATSVTNPNPPQRVNVCLGCLAIGLSVEQARVCNFMRTDGWIWLNGDGSWTEDKS